MSGKKNGEKCSSQNSTKKRGENTSVSDCLVWATQSTREPAKAGTKSKTKTLDGSNMRKSCDSKPQKSETFGVPCDEIDGAAKKLERCFLDPGADDDSVVCYVEDTTIDAKKKGNKKEKSKNKDEESEPKMSQLMSHHYQRAAEEKRKTREEEIKQKKEAERSQSRGRRTDSKANKTAQLRAIAVSESCDSVSKNDKNQQLWKMKKFSNVKPKIKCVAILKKSGTASKSKDQNGKRKEDDETLPAGENYKDEIESQEWVIHRDEEEEFIQEIKQETYWGDDNDTGLYREMEDDDSFLPPAGYPHTTRGYSSDAQRDSDGYNHDIFVNPSLY